MKKYLMTAFAAVAFGAAFVSCSHSEDLSGGDTPTPQPNPEKQKYTAELIKSEYNALFEKTFGKVGANVDWGFGSDPVGTRAFTRATVHNVTFPDAPASYPNSYGDAAAYTGGYKYINGEALYMADESIKNVELQGKGSLYLAKSANGNGSYTPSTYWYVGNVPYSATNEYKLKVYLLPGVTLNLAANQENFQQNVEFYVCPTASIVCAGQLRLNSATLYVASGASVTASNLEVNGTGNLYNQGTITLSGNLSVKNAASYIVNEGSISAKNYGSEGSGSFWNVSGGEVTIAETTTVNSNSNGWINEGQYTTKNFTYTAGSINVWNKCKLSVTGLFNMWLGDSDTSTFYMDGGSSMIAGSYKMHGPARINMAANSLIIVSGTATMDCTKANYGIYGPTSGNAVFQAHQIVKGTENQGFEVTYGNNLYVYSETTHFEQGHDGNPSHPFIDFDGSCSTNNIYASNFQAGKPNVTIPSNGNCSDGFDGGGDPNVYRVIVEDLNANETSSDFDFNDAVFDVYKENGKWMIKLRAAGGIYPLTVDGKEVHQQFGYQAKEDGTYDMINTGQKGGSIAEADLPKWECSNQNISSKDDIKAIPVVVKKPSYEGGLPDIEITLYAEKGGVACKILVDGEYTFCKERTGISTDYQYFNDYVSGTYNPNSRGGKDWWK